LNPEILLNYTIIRGLLQVIPIGGISIVSMVLKVTEREGFQPRKIRGALSTVNE